MTIHLVTVGDSIRRSFLNPPDDRPVNPRLVDRRGHLLDAQLLGIDEEREQVTEFLERLGDREPTAVEAARDAIHLAEVTVAGDGGSGWPSTVSAESTGLAATVGSLHVRSEDLVILLTSDTAPGLLAAFWNAALILVGRVEAISYLDAPDGLLRPGAANPQTDLPDRGGVLVARIADLDMRRPGSISRAMSRLGTLARRVLFARSPHEPVAVHLSGGYKATLPFLYGIAEAMQSIEVNGGYVDLSVHVVHFDSLATAGMEAIRLPLRRLNATALRDELAVFEAGRAHVTDRRGDALEGYAYEQRGQELQLNEFGFGYTALLGHPQAATW